MNQTASPTLSWLTPEQSRSLARRRRVKDILARSTIMLGGLAVIAAILLIFFYLLWEVMPLFQSSSLEDRGHYSLPVAPSSPAGPGRSRAGSPGP